MHIKYYSIPEKCNQKGSRVGRSRPFFPTQIYWFGNNSWTNYLCENSRNYLTGSCTPDKQEPRLTEAGSEIWDFLSPASLFLVQHHKIRKIQPSSQLLLGEGSIWFKCPVHKLLRGIPRGPASVLPVLEFWQSNYLGDNGDGSFCW